MKMREHFHGKSPLILWGNMTLIDKKVTNYNLYYNTMSLTKKISVSEDVWISLYELKKPGQTYDSLLEEIVNHEKELRFLQEMDMRESEADFEEILL